MDAAAPKFCALDDLPPIMTGPQVCNLLQVSKRTLARLTADGTIRYLKLGHGAIRFVRDQVLEDIGLISARQARRIRTPAALMGT